MKKKQDENKKKATYRSFGFKPSRVKDAELIDFLEKQSNINAYLKELVYKDMKKK